MRCFESEDLYFIKLVIFSFWKIEYTWSRKIRCFIFDTILLSRIYVMDESSDFEEVTEEDFALN